MFFDRETRGSWVRRLTVATGVGLLAGIMAVPTAGAQVDSNGIDPSTEPVEVPDPSVQGASLNLGAAGAELGLGGEPGPIVDALVRFLNLLGIRGTTLVVPPSGSLPGVSLGLSATGSVDASAGVSGCPDKSVCFWPKMDFKGTRSVYTQGGAGYCLNTTGAGRIKSVVNNLERGVVVCGPPRQPLGLPPGTPKVRGDVRATIPRHTSNPSVPLSVAWGIN